MSHDAAHTTTNTAPGTARARPPPRLGGKCAVPTSSSKYIPRRISALASGGHSDRLANELALRGQPDEDVDVRVLLFLQARVLLLEARVLLLDAPRVHVRVNLLRHR